MHCNIKTKFSATYIKGNFSIHTLTHNNEPRVAHSQENNTLTNIYAYTQLLFDVLYLKPFYIIIKMSLVSRHVNIVNNLEQSKSSGAGKNKIKIIIVDLIK